MGIVDIVILNEIYQECNRLEKIWKWGFEFKQDSGSYETAILIHDNGEIHSPNTICKYEKDEYKIFVPDIMDLENKMIIEYEEEAKPMKGPKIRKRGHWDESKRDTRRDESYHKAGFRLCKIWESSFKDNSWKTKLFQFLSNCYRNQTTA